MLTRQGEAEKRRDRIERAAVGIAAAAGSMRLGPAGPVIVAAVPYLQDLVKNAYEEFKSDAQKRITDMLGSACEASEREPEALECLIRESPQTRLLAKSGHTRPVSASGRFPGDPAVEPGQRAVVMRNVKPSR
jgi:hypothetical protein